MEPTRIITHRPTGTPLECIHCRYCWYGTGCSYKNVTDKVLCDLCWEALDTHIWAKRDRYKYMPMSTEREALGREIRNDGQTWLADKTTVPRKRTHERRFDKSVPKWMRSAIQQGLIKTSDEGMHTIQSCNNIAITAKLHADKS